MGKYRAALVALCLATLVMLIYLQVKHSSISNSFKTVYLYQEPVREEKTVVSTNGAIQDISTLAGATSLVEKTTQEEIKGAYAQTQLRFTVCLAGLIFSTTLILRSTRLNTGVSLGVCIALLILNFVISDLVTSYAGVRKLDDLALVGTKEAMADYAIANNISIPDEVMLQIDKALLISSDSTSKSEPIFIYSPDTKTNLTNAAISTLSIPGTTLKLLSALCLLLAIVSDWRRTLCLKQKP